MTHASEPDRRGPSSTVVHVLMGLLCLIWGSTYLVIREGLRDLPPFTSAGVRFLVACAVLSALAPWLAPREGGTRPTPRLALSMGVLNIGLPYALVYWSETVLPSGLVSVLWASFPLMMALTGHVFLPDERIAGVQWSGFLAGFVGVAFLFATDLRALGPEALPAGLLVLLSPAIYALGSAIVKRHGGDTSSVLLNQRGTIIGAALLLSLALAFERDADVRWSGLAVGSVLYLAVVGTVVTFSLYYWLMRYAPAYKLALIAYVIPVVALTLGALVADEPVGPQTFVGTGLVLLGVALVHRGGGRRPQSPPSASDPSPPRSAGSTSTP